MQVGLGCTSRDFCDGQSLASPGRWAPDERQYPETESWREVVGLFRKYAETYTSARLLVELSLGKVSQSPFSPESITELKYEVITRARSHGMELLRNESDRNVPKDFRFMDLVLRLAGDPEVGLGDYAQVRVGPGIRMPRLPALYRSGDGAFRSKQTLWSIWMNTRPVNYTAPLEEQVLGNPT